MNLPTKSFANNVLNVICQTLMSVILVINVPNGNTHKRCDVMTYKGSLRCGCLRGEFFKGYWGIIKIQGSRILQVHRDKIVCFSIQGNHLKLQIHSTQSRKKKQLLVDKHTGYSIKRWPSQHWVYLWLYLALCIGQSKQSLYICFSEGVDNISFLKEILERLRLEVAQRYYCTCQLSSDTLISWRTLISKWCMAYCPEYD